MPIGIMGWNSFEFCFLVAPFILFQNEIPSTIGSSKQSGFLRAIAVIMGLVIRTWPTWMISGLNAAAILRSTSLSYVGPWGFNRPSRSIRLNTAIWAGLPSELI